MGVADDLAAESIRLTLRDHPNIVIFVFAVGWIFTALVIFLCFWIFATKQSVQEMQLNLATIQAYQSSQKESAVKQEKQIDRILDILERRAR